MWGLCTLLLVSWPQCAVKKQWLELSKLPRPQYRVSSAKQIYALRFVIGMLEGSCFVGVGSQSNFLHSSWSFR